MTVEATTDSLGRPARVTTLPVEVDGRTVEHRYAYDAATGDLLQRELSDPDGKPSGVTLLVYLGSEVTDQAPR